MHPCASMQATATAEGAALTEGDLALQHLRSMLPTPGEKAAAEEDEEEEAGFCRQGAGPASEAR